MNYYCLIAGLPDIEIDDNKLVYSVADFKKELYPFLSSDHSPLIELFYTKFDNQNLLHYVKDKETKFDDRGNITKDELEEGLKLLSEDDYSKNKDIPPYFKTFVDEYREAQNDSSEKWENRLAALYYKWAMNCGNTMISKWFEFNMNLNNVLLASVGRKYHIEVDVVGDNEIAESIRTSNQRDFGLTGTLDELVSFQRIAEEQDLYEREKKIDLLKWQWLDEQTFFKYFTIERVFAYLVKLEIIERWVSLDPEKGGKIFRELINSLKNSAVKKK